MKRLKAWVIGMLCILPVQAGAPKPIRDPRAWAMMQFDRLFGDTRLEEFTLDLDQDGIPELFLGAKVSIGNGGGSFFIFRKMKEGYRKVGHIGLHPRAIRPLESRKGSCRFGTYWHMSADSGVVAIYSYDGRRIKLISQKTVQAPNPMADFICHVERTD